MLCEQFNRHGELLQRYDDLCQMVAFRYGAHAQGHVLVLYEELIEIRQALAKAVSEGTAEPVVLRAWVRDISQRLADRYWNQPVQSALEHPTAIVGTDPVVVEYSRALFQEKYGGVIDIVRAETVEVTDAALDGVQRGRPYMYVIDDLGRFLLWERPFSFTELAFGRQRATVGGVPIGHPMLVPDRLRAIAAGEIVFVGTPHVCAVIVNNKSGHFRFPPSCGQVIKETCGRLLHLPDRDIDIFLVGGFDPRLVRRVLVPAPDLAGSSQEG